jgi:hypothetical protein
MEAKKDKLQKDNHFQFLSSAGFPRKINGWDGRKGENVKWD